MLLLSLGSNQCGFTKGEIMPHAFWKEVTALVDEKSEVDTVYHAAKKGFSTVSQTH